MASFTEDEVLALGAIVSRLLALFSLRDMTGWMEEDEAGKQTPAWDIISALIERGRLGVKEEELVSCPPTGIDVVNSRSIGPSVD